MLEVFALSLKGTESIAGGSAPGKLQSSSDPERVKPKQKLQVLWLYGRVRPFQGRNLSFVAVPGASLRLPPAISFHAFSVNIEAGLEGLLAGWNDTKVHE
ncbi:MAG: hypothetical protein H0U18_12005 [Pyrinomonadaceae bacterium]|nr:hypothetical protein [Pyrinomonadaceae bacterium]